jgi:hypothetical protein
MATLTPKQIEFFEAFGFLHLPGLVADRIGEIFESFDQVWRERGGGHDGVPHDHRQRSVVAPFIDQHPALCALLDDSRIHSLACQLVGEDFNYMGSDGNLYAGDTSWHSDGWQSHIRFIKLAFYLDPLTPETGALRVIPGSHRVGDRYGEQLQRVLTSDGFGVPGSAVPFWSVSVRPGDLMLFDHNTKHASFGGGSNRRMFTMNLCQRFPEERLGELQDYLAGGARFHLERNVGEIMLRTASPQRRRHLEQVMANDFKLAVESRRLREAGLATARG